MVLRDQEKTKDASKIWNPNLPIAPRYLSTIEGWTVLTRILYQ